MKELLYYSEKIPMAFKSGCNLARNFFVTKFLRSAGFNCIAGTTDKIAQRLAVPGIKVPVVIR